MFTVVKFLKTPETKLVAIKVKISNKCLITSIRIEGDYFAVSPQPIDDLMQVELSIDPLSVIETVSGALKKAGVYGMAIPDVLNKLKKALEEAKERCAGK